MPARQPRPTRAQDPEYLAELGGVLLAMTDTQRREFLAGLDRDNLEVAERALAARIAVSWRATPVTMGVHFGALKPWRYSLLLGEKFADAVEGRSTRQIWNLGPQWGKPVCVDELVSMADGSYRRLGDIKVGDLVVTHLGRARAVLDVHEQGVLPVRRVVTAGGRSIVAAPDHPFLTADGWLPVDELQPTRPGLPGDVLAVVVPDALGATTRDAVEFRLAGYFIGDGSVTTNTKGSLSCNMTCADPVEAADLYLCAEKMGWTVTVTPRPLPHASRYGFRLVAGGKAEDGPRPWLRAAGIAGSTSHTKRVPDWIMTAPAWAVAEFLGAYFACDGSISRAAGRNSGRSIEYYSINRDLLVDVRRLLARLGIYGRLRRKWATSNNFASGPVESWRLGMTGSDSMARFAAQIPVHHSKAERLTEIDVRPQSFERRWLPDSVTAIEDAGMAECRCLTVADDSSFVVDDVAVHNSRVGSQWGPAWALDRYPERRFILTSYGDDLANRNSYAVRQILREHRSELHVRLQSDQQRQDRFTTPQGGGILAAGIGSGLTGWGAHGAVIDDPFKNWIDAHSAARRELVYNQYRSVIRMRLTEEWAFLIVIQTRWHEDDLTGRLIDAWQDGTGEEFEIVRLPEIAEDPDPTSSNPILRLPDPLGRAPGEILEPERFSKAAVAGRKLAAGTYLWAGLHQQRPAPEEGTEIQRAWFRLEEAMPERFDAALTAWDMKLKDNEAGDYVVGQCWLRTGSDFWLIDQLRGQWNQATTTNAIALLAVRHPEVRQHVIENTGNGPEVMESLRQSLPDYVLDPEMAGQLGMTEDERLAVQALRRRGLPGLLPYNPKGSKSIRMRAHAPLLEAGNVHLNARASWLGAYLDEVAAFPNGAHDDAIDATSCALSRLSHGTASVASPASAPLPTGGPSVRTGARFGVIPGARVR